MNSLESRLFYGMPSVPAENTSRIGTRELWPVSSLSQFDATRGRVVSVALPIGTQAKFIDAAHTAVNKGTALNHHLTLRLTALRQRGASSAILGRHPSDAVTSWVELFRKWLTKRELQAHYIWVREIGRKEGEHLHIAFHLGSDLQDYLLSQCESWFDEELEDVGQYNLELPIGTVGKSYFGGFMLQQEMNGFHGIPKLAAYLGKGEPDHSFRYRRIVENDSKLVHNYEYQGLIEGSPKRHNRFGISRGLI